MYTVTEQETLRIKICSGRKEVMQMRMEKINSNQIRVMISDQDLAEWKLSIREMKYGSKETTELFRQMIGKAMQQYSFNQDGLPLMIEAVPVSQEELMLIISAVEDAEELDPHFASFSPPDPTLPGFTEERRNPASAGRGNGNGPQSVVLAFEDIDSVMEFSWSFGSGLIGRSDLYRQPGGSGVYMVIESGEDLPADSFERFLNGIKEYADMVPGGGPLAGWPGISGSTIRR